MNKILFLGDFLYDEDDVKTDIKNISRWVKRNHYKCILNLEGPLDNSNRKKWKRGPNLVQSKITPKVLKELNVKAVTLANNHLLDYCSEGLEKTINILKDNHIYYCGAGNNLEEALKPIRFRVQKNDIVILNFGWDIEETVYAKGTRAGCAPKEKKLMLEQIKKYKTKDTIVIVVVHWGYEFHLRPMPYDITLAHQMIDSGADMIIGHHPHNIQSYEIYHNKLIYYSLGNFYFGTRRDNFNKKIFPVTLAKRCNYGLGIIYNVDKREVEKEVIFKYDDQLKKTIIIDKSNETKILFDNISNVNRNHKSYLDTVKKLNINPKPIFTNSFIQNKLCMFKLKVMIFPYKNIRKYLSNIVKSR